MNDPDPVKKPYRPCAGVVLFNHQGKVLVGQRNDLPANPAAAPGPAHPWQLPQGGIDRGEDPYDAARRELREETSITSTQLIAPAEDWLSYDFPPHLALKLNKGKYRGQRQMWYALLFTGTDDEINILQPDGGRHRAEFSDWRWEKLENLPDLAVPFKRDVYAQLVDWFADIPEKVRHNEIHV